jgi:S-adenosyl-L-methionine hydrolase (adenosine-forming)
MTAPVITFLSDYGLGDDFVGVCHGVIAGICPDARVIDISHGVRRHDVRGGALLLRGSLPYMPAGVHLAVVDPDVGAARRAVAVRAADDRLFVGPDNGLLVPAAERFGGVVEAVDIARSRFRLEPVSATFHGRDIFAPIASRLAWGVPLAEVGEPVDPGELATLELPRPRSDADALVAHAVYVDRFGNVQLDADHEHLAELGLKLGRPVRVELGSGDRYQAVYARTFADVSPGELLIYEDAHGVLALALNYGSAAERLDIDVDGELRISQP